MGHQQVKVYHPVVMTSLTAQSYSVAVPHVSREFNVRSIVSALGMTLFLFGFGLGPLLWAPLSEVYGRKMPALIPSVVGMVFTFSTAASKDIQVRISGHILS